MPKELDTYGVSFRAVVINFAVFVKFRTMIRPVATSGAQIISRRSSANTAFITIGNRVLIPMRTKIIEISLAFRSQWPFTVVFLLFGMFVACVRAGVVSNF